MREIKAHELKVGMTVNLGLFYGEKPDWQVITETWINTEYFPNNVQVKFGDRLYNFPNGIKLESTELS